jgi:glycosyltransferase involved in cell wall biosynthesis
VLVCTPFAPRLDARHGGKATAQLLLRLAERNDVALLYLRAPAESAVDPLIASHCRLVEETPLPREGRLPHRLVWGLGVLRGLPPWATDCRSSEYASALERVLDEWRPDLVEIHLQVMAQYVQAPARRNIPRILVDYDPGSAWASELLGMATGPSRFVRRLEVGAWRHYERATRPRFDAIVVFAERDVAAVKPTAGGARLVRIPLAIEVPELPLDHEGTEPPTILFVGGFAHHPNTDAALWLAREIFPRVVERAPDARLDLVGHDPGPEVCALAQGAVSVHASVPDVTPYLDRAAVVVAPIRIGGSMRMKVLEALAAGKALVATPRAAEGVAAIPGDQFVLAATEDELVDALTGLLLDRERRRTLGVGARAWAERNLGWQHGVEAFERLYDSLVETP